MKAPLRIGLAGLGVHGTRYATHLLLGEIAGAQLAAVSRSDAGAGRKLASQHGLEFVADPLELATKPGIDAVVACLPPDLHPALARACLAAGRPVLVEKPLAPSASAAREIARLSETAKAPLMVAQTLRFDPLIARMREELQRVGKIRVVALSQRFEPSGRDWIDSPGQGGCVLNTGVHSFDLLRFLTGAEVESVQAEVAHVVTRATDDEMVVAARLEPGTILATVDNARTTGGRSGRIEIAGEHGQLVGDHVHRALHWIEGRRQHDLGRVPEAPTVARTLAAFVPVARGEAAPPVTARDGCAAVEVVEAVLLSARLGRRVLVSEVLRA